MERATRESRRNEVKEVIQDIESLIDNGHTRSVRAKAQELEELIEAFKQSHLNFHAQLEAEEEQVASKEYYKSAERDIRIAHRFIDVHLRANERDDEKMSVSHQSDRTSSSTSSERARVAARRAALRAEAEMLKRKQALEEEEMRLNQRKQRLHLETEIAKAEAEEAVFSQYECNEDNVKVNHQDIIDNTPVSLLPENVRVNNEPMTLLYQQQKQLVDVMQAPRAQMSTFNGDPLKYYMFIRAYENNVDKTMLDDSAKLTRLIQYCSGKAHTLLQCCAVMEPSLGYRKAKELLKKRFGNEHVIGKAWITKIIERDIIKSHATDILQEYADDLRNCKETLEAMGEVCMLELNTQTTLVSVIEKLPLYLKNRWKSEVKQIRKRNKIPKFVDIVEFVEDAAEEANDPIFGGQREEQVKKTKVKGSSFNVDVDSVHAAEGRKPWKGNCVLCNRNHSLFGCDAFKLLKPIERLEVAKYNKLCYNCLRPGHASAACSLNRTCTVLGCGRKHTKFLHQLSEHNSQVVQEPQVHTIDAACNVAGAGAVKVALPIVPVKVKSPGGDIITYALLDNGSTNSFCTEALLKQLGVEGRKETLSLTTISQANVHMTTSIVRLEVAHVHTDEIIELPTVYSKANLPIRQSNVAKAEDISMWPHLRDLQIPQLSVERIDILIGQDVPEALLPLEVRKGEKGAPYAVKTKLGWTLNGPFGKGKRRSATVNFVDTAIERQVETFWKLEGSELLNDTSLGMSVNDKQALNIWEHSTTYSDGHYEAVIPFKNGSPEFPCNRYMAEKRLMSLSRKLTKDSQLAAMYGNTMQDLIDKEYAEVVPSHEVNRNDGAVWYLPHHAVYHAHKPGKCRIVFDCAAKHRGVSLNSETLQGPDLTNLLIGVLLRFRLGPIALMADIQAMFHQVRVAANHRDTLRFLWWPDANVQDTPHVYRMKVHPFGGTWSPSCCNFVLHRTAMDNKSQYDNRTIETVLRNFYVDDCLKSLSSETDAIKLVDELRGLLAKGGFRLTKWVSNSRHVLNSIPEEEKAIGVRGLDLNTEMLPDERALGVCWEAENDNLRFNISPKDKPITRRGMLSIVSSVYDPLGLAGPFILLAKKIIQEVTRAKLGWDDTLPEFERKQWQQWLEDLPRLQDLRVPRCVIQQGTSDTIRKQLHHFADASETGYGVVTYLCVLNKQGQTHCSLMMSKSRLSPIKTVTIPRLELAAAALAVRVDAMMRRELDIQVDASVFWTDSMLVLQYITNESKRFQTFVANRIAVIHGGSKPSQWWHVPTELNPADDASRGLCAKDIVTSKRWVNGPEFLWGDECNWPIQPEILALNEEDVEVKHKPAIQAYMVDKGDAKDSIDQLIEWYSDWHALKKGVAWILKLKATLRRKVQGSRQDRITTEISVEDLNEAEDAIIRYVQRQAYGVEVAILEKGHSIKKTSSLYRLEPKLSRQGVLCLGGRLKNAPLTDQGKHPAILPNDHHAALLIARCFHESSGHSGREHVVSLIRERYWVVKARSLVRRVLSKCVTCKRIAGRPVVQKLADLPADRVTPGEPPFTHVGVDCFGPFIVKHGRSDLKRYGCLFTCLTTRAIHIEVVHSMETDSFVNALQRFISRRGRPNGIRSDNGTNFVGGERELRKSIQLWNQRKIENFLHQSEIKWQFNPPTASHMGGVWERMIRSVRKVLSAVMKEQTLDDEGLSTLMCLVEGIVNGRPLTTVSDDSKDPEPLTPNHLLLLRAGPSVPPGHFIKEDLYARKRWRRVQYLADIFWRRWIREYLPLLQTRQKSLTERGKLKVNDLVLIVDDNSVRNSWLMGRITNVHTSGGGFVRSVKIQTKTSVIERPVQKVVLLESVE